MTFHKLKPVFINEQLRFGLCLFSSSVLIKPGHLQAHYYNSPDFEEYSIKDEKWEKSTSEPLSEQEKTVLIFAKQGKTNEQIADILDVKHQTIRNIENSIYHKWQVNSIVQAIIYGTNHNLIFQQVQSSNSIKSTSKKQRLLITPEKLRYIQQELNHGKSVNSIANQVNVSESTIRYHICKKRLKKS